MKCPGCFQYIDGTSQLCTQCWDDYAKMVDEETHQMKEQAMACDQDLTERKIFIGSGEDVPWIL